MCVVTKGATARRLGGEGIGRDATAALRLSARALGRLETGRLFETRFTLLLPEARGFPSCELDGGRLAGRLDLLEGFLRDGGFEPEDFLILPPLPVGFRPLLLI